jgi:hypothetical protein
MPYEDMSRKKQIFGYSLLYSALPAAGEVVLAVLLGCGTGAGDPGLFCCVISEGATTPFNEAVLGIAAATPFAGAETTPFVDGMGDVTETPFTGDTPTGGMGD